MRFPVAASSYKLRYFTQRFPPLNRAGAIFWYLLCASVKITAWRTSLHQATSGAAFPDLAFMTAGIFC